MRKLFLLSLFLFLVLVAFVNLKNVNAAPFASAYLRLNNLSANSALSGTVCAIASSAGAGTEDKILITFPSDFTISTNASNWTTSTTNLPAGATAWPGIGSTATSVSSKTVTFTSSDLLTTSQYCFNFSGASSTTGAAGSEKLGSITSKNSTDTTIDSTTYALAITSSNQISVTASVDPQVSDLQVAIESTTAGTTFPQDTNIDYKITYGNASLTSVPLTIQAEWSQGTIDGNPSPSVDILDYVIGSASNAYSSTPPVIDTVNRTITWTISSIPASTTGQVVTFTLKTNDSYTGSNLVSFDVSGRATSGSTTTPDVTVTRNYQYSGVSASPTPTPRSSTTTPTPTPTPTISNPIISDISIRSVSSNNATIYVSTNTNSTFTVLYGTSINSLSKTIKTLTPEKESVIAFSDLEADTIYYFKVIATSEDKRTTTSDIFTFRTAILSPIPSIDTQSLIVTSSNNILFSSQIKKGYNLKENILVLPRQTVFTIQFSLNKNITLKSIQAIIRNKGVLGFSTLDEVTAGTNYVNLVEVQPGIYTGKIATPDSTGSYEVYVRLIDFNGNILEQKILDLSVTNKFKVLEKGSKDKPVENARVLFYLFNLNTKTYSVISPQILPIQNPIYSTPDGRYNITLPYGKYKADISAIGYNPETVEFEINQYSQDYPVVYLEKNPSLLNTIDYYLDILKDTIIESQNYIRQRADSNRLFDLSTFGAILVFIVISILSISARTHIRVMYLPYFLIFKLKIIFKKGLGSIIFGKVINKEGIPISKANVYLLTSDEKQTIAVLKTNKLGEFYFHNLQGLDYKIRIEKEDIETPPTFEFINSKTKDVPIVFKVNSKGKIKQSLLEVTTIYIEDFLGMGMESLILLSLVVQIYFVFTFGFLRVAPFLIITILNLVLMFTYLYRPRKLGN